MVNSERPDLNNIAETRSRLLALKSNLLSAQGAWDEGQHGYAMDLVKEGCESPEVLLRMAVYQLRAAVDLAHEEMGKLDDYIAKKMKLFEPLTEKGKNHAICAALEELGRGLILHEGNRISAYFTGAKIRGVFFDAQIRFTARIMEAFGNFSMAASNWKYLGNLDESERLMEFISELNLQDLGYLDEMERRAKIRGEWMTTNAELRLKMVRDAYDLFKTEVKDFAVTMDEAVLELNKEFNKVLSAIELELLKNTPSD